MRDLQKLVEEVKSDMKKMGVPYNNNFSVCLRDKAVSYTHLTLPTTSRV